MKLGDFPKCDRKSWEPSEPILFALHSGEVGLKTACEFVEGEVDPVLCTRERAVSVKG
jgi:hypothetical protein